MTTLVVPIDVQALCVGNPDAEQPGLANTFVGPSADFSHLPYADNDDSPHNAGPYLSGAVIGDPTSFAGTGLYPPGVHLHWALPPGLAHSVQDETGEQRFPRVPTRWLVTRIAQSGEAGSAPALFSWIVESDRLSGQPTVDVPLNTLTQPTMPLAPGEAPNFGFLGAWYELANWPNDATGATTWPALTATGYGEAAFAGLYPNSCTSFGLYDALSGLPVGWVGTLSYHVAGWYGTAADDPLASGVVASGDNPYGFAWIGDGVPTATMCSGLVDGIGWDPTMSYLTDAPQKPTVVLADTGTEALSALAGTLATGSTPSVIETTLNEFQFGLLPKSGQIDVGVGYSEALHASGFAEQPGGTVWTVVAQTAAASGPVGAPLRQPPPVEVTLPPGLADQLDALNALQASADDAVQRLAVMRAQLFADWQKADASFFVATGVDSGSGIPALPIGGLRGFLAEQVAAIEGPGGAAPDLDSLLVQVEIAAAQLREALAAAGVDLPLVLRGDSPAETYKAPIDPVVLLSGPDVTVADRHRPLGAAATGGATGGEWAELGASSGLPCRLDNEVLSGLSLTAGFVPGSEAASLVSTALPGLPAPLPVPQATLADALLREALLLAPSLQPVVGAALIDQLGAEIALTTVTSALQTAVANLLNGTPPAGAAYTGIAPAPVLLNAWSGTPWLPLLMEYQVEYAPLQLILPPELPSSSDPHPASGSYSPDFVTGAVALAPGAIDLEYPASAPQTASPRAYNGTMLLTSGVVADILGEIERFVDNAGDLDPSLTAVLGQLQTLPLLAQQLTGLSEALVMQALVLQLPVADPTGMQPLTSLSGIVSDVADAVAEQTSVAPMPELPFSPVRAGSLYVSGLRLIDAFGRVKAYSYAADDPALVVSEALTAPAAYDWPDGLALLPPRITQFSRLLFRWLAADNAAVESGSRPATTPVVGWLVPDWVDRSFTVYASDGTPLCILGIGPDDASVLVTPAPGGTVAPDFGDTAPPGALVSEIFAGQNGDLAAFAEAVVEQGGPFLAAFFDTVQDALDFTLPAAFRESAESAVLAGQPLAIARAALTLEVAGGTAASESWASFVERVSYGGTLDDAGLSQVQFPVQLGGSARLDDSLVGYWVDGASGEATDWLTFYAPGARAAGNGIRPTADAPILLTPTATSHPQLTVTLLLDPRGVVHATTGVLPVTELRIPPEFSAVISSLSLALPTWPVIAPAQAVETSLALPKVSSGTWSWVTADESGWVTAPTTDAAAAATLDYTPQIVDEGWLVLRPEASGEVDPPEARGKEPT